MKNYVISVRRTKDYLDRPLDKNKQYYEYAGYDDHAGSFSSGMPSWDNEFYCKIFSSVDNAKTYWLTNSQYLFDDRHDWTTLAIRERTVVYKTIEAMPIY